MSSTPRIITLESVDSTNAYLRALPLDTPDFTVATARCQTAGRGQRGNRWESAPGENITLSMLFRPGAIPPAGQFAISRAVALAAADLVAECLPDAVRPQVAVKWPNDIYVADSKIAGILIEHSLSGNAISRTIIGIGLNVNQLRFVSDAPNPVSLAQLAGRTFDVDALTLRLCSLMRQRLEAERDSDGTLSADEYLSRLWRRAGFHPYREAGSSEVFTARIAAVSPMGFITLERPDGTSSSYAFKEVSPIL